MRATRKLAPISNDAECAPTPPQREGPATRSVVEIDMLVVDDRALLVPHDIVAVQTIAVLVEIIFAFGAGVFLHRENGFTDLGRVGGAGFVDRRGEDGDGVIGPGALVIGCELVGVAIGLAESLRRFAG